MIKHKTHSSLMGNYGWYYRDGRPSAGGYYIDTETSYPLPDNWRTHE